MFHATNVDLKVGDYLLPNNGRIYGTKEKWQCLIFGRNNDSLRDLGSQVGSFLITEAGGDTRFNLFRTLSTSLWKRV